MACALFKECISMTYDAKIHHRRSIRLKNYDYSQAGLYFITICTHERQLLLGRIDNGRMQLNPWGEIVQRVWFELPEHYAHIRLHEFMIMPNHIHGIISIGEIHSEDAMNRVSTAISRKQTRRLRCER